MDPSRTRFCDLDFWARIRAYIEIVLVTTVSFLYAAGVVSLASKNWTEWANQFKWQFGLGVGIIGLLPFLVIAAVVWRVNLRIFGSQVSPEPTQSASDISQGVKGPLPPLPAAEISQGTKGTLEES